MSNREIERFQRTQNLADGNGNFGPTQGLTSEIAVSIELATDSIDIRVIQVLRGHAKLENTSFYTEVATRTVRIVTAGTDILASLAFARMSCHTGILAVGEPMKQRGESFDDRLRPIASRLYGYARALAADAELAADLYQETILKAISSPAVPEGERPLRAWLFTIMRNHWIDRLRMQRRQPEVDALEDHCAVEAFMPASLETVIVNRLAVRQAFAMLGAQHRDVLTLVDVGGFSYDEAAEMLGVPRGTIMSRVSRARQALCRLLADENVTMHPSAGRSAGR